MKEAQANWGKRLFHGFTILRFTECLAGPIPNDTCLETLVQFNPHLFERVLS